MDSKVLEIYKLLQNAEISKACELAQSYYNSQKTDKSLDAVKVLAISYMLKPDHRLAYLYFKEAYSIEENDFEIITNLASCAFEMQDFQLSFEMANKSMQKDPDKHMAYVTLSNIYLTTKEIELAKQNVLKAIAILGGDIPKLYSSHEDIIILYLDILTALNENQKIIDIFNLIKQTKRNSLAGLLHVLNRVDKSAISIADISEAKNQIEILKSMPDNNKTLLARAHLNFCLGDYYLKEDPSISDEYFIEGNSIISGLQRFKPLDHQKRIIETIKNFLKIKDYKVSNQEKGKGLIFITGLPRSGTTLAESIVASNNDTCAGGELDVLRFAIPKDFINEPTLEKIEELGDAYINTTNFLRKDKKYFVDKLPQNFELIGLISVCLPGAKIINMNRKFWDVAISQFQQYYVRNVPYTSSFFSMAITAANYEFIISQYEKQVDPSKLLQINYEELVLNKTEMIHQIYNFCQIQSDYNSQERSKHISKTASSSQVKGEIHQKSLNKNNFADYKERFMDAYEMQKSFWISKNIEN